MNFLREKNKKKGFTLIEMLVSLTLYTFVITMALGALFMILKANEKTKLIKTVTNNINLSLESMSRELRVGSNYSALTRAGGNSASCALNSMNCNQIVFKTKEGCLKASYYWENNQIFRILPKKQPNGSCTTNPNPVVITGEEGLSVDRLAFFVRGNGANDGHPKVTILLDATATINSGLISGAVERFHIQTTISQRTLED